MLNINIRNMKFTIFQTLVLGFLVAGIAQAQTTTNDTIFLNLEQAQEYALQSNANARNSALDLEIAKKKIWETTAIGLPQINAQANYQHIFKVPEMSFGGITYLATGLPGGTVITSDDINNGNVYLGYAAMDPIKLGVKDNVTVDFTLTQLLFSGEYIVGLQASKVFYLMSEQNKEKTELNLKESVANSYAMALVLEQTRVVLAQSLQNTKKTLGDMRKMYEQGLIENTDVDQIEMVSLTLSNGLSSLDRQIDATYDLLKFQLGMPFDEKLVLTDNLENMATDISLEDIISNQFDISQNLDYQILETNEVIGDLNLKREMSTYLPNLAAVYLHNEKLNKPDFDFSPRDVVQVTMNVPIFSSFQRHVKVQQRRLELQKITNTKNDVANGLQLQYINTKNELTTAYEKYLNDRKNIELTKRIYDKTLIKFNEGLASSRDITDNLNQYLTAQSNMYNSILTLISAKNKLQKLNNTL